MAVDTPAGHIYTGNGNTRVFPIPTRIIGDDYVRIELDGVYLSDRTQWDIVNNSIIFITAPANGTVVNIKVATSEEALSVLGSSTNVDIVATNMTDVNTVVNNINNIDTVATNINNVNIVAGNISKVNTVATNIVGINQIVDNLHEILSADESASTATTKASEASASATSASTSASQALTSRNQAETFKNSASTSATTATTKASEASASATTATTKASEASASATSASTSASQALTSRNQAETFAQQAQASASSVDANNIVHRSGDESIGGVKTFSSTIDGSINGNSATATKLTNSQSDWASSGAIANVVGMLGWKKYNNNHVIFDASASTSPSGSAIDNIIPQNPWIPAYPTLMGWNGSSTFGVRVDTSRYSENGVIASSNSTNGYIKLGNGLIIQWGRFTSTTTDFQDVNFNIAFTNYVFYVGPGATFQYYNMDNPALWTPTIMTNSYFKANRNDAITTNKEFCWLAIGY